MAAYSLTLACGALVVASCCAAAAAVTALDPPSMAVRIGAGVYQAAGRTVKVPASSIVTIAAPDRVSVKREEVLLGDDKPGTWAGGTSLAKTLGPVDTGTRLPQAIDPGSVRVYGSIDGGPAYKEGEDYVLEHSWGGMSRVPGGAIPQGSKVYVDYDVCLERVDLVQASSEGAVSVKKGRAVPVCARAALPDAGCTSLAVVYVPYRTASISSESILPAPARETDWQRFIKTSGRSRLSRTLGLLKTGKPAAVVCWGDSVTQGGSPSSHDKCYVELLRSRLRAAYPESQITLINAGIGGSNTDSRRDGFEKEVLAHNPDLITVEFINDVGLGPDRIRANWAEFVSRARRVSPQVEFIFITPHFVMAEWMGSHPAAMEAMRQSAEENGAALADTTHVWAHLREVGIPYQTLLANGINHPDDLGHEFFAATLMRLLAPTRAR